MVNLFHGDAEAAQSIIAMKPDLISFTGSFETGMKVKSATNSYSPKLILEMGGSNPIIICKSADLKKAASVIAESAFSNSGQRCASASRLIVHESVLDNLIPLLHSSVETLVSTTGRESFSGCLVSLDAKKKHVDFLNNARLSGSNVLEFNYEKSLEGCYVNPAVVTRNQDKNQDGFVEIFSPILFVEVFNEIEEALLKANSTTYGLTAAVWTDDFSESFYFSNHVKSGVVNINGPTHGAEFQFPFGGQGFSGNGAKEVGINCLAEYSFERLISVTAYGK
jgi:aldehyde dehydrogenase (NAD+)